ncbi:MAG: transcriptional regulator [Flavobacterium sp.]|nr:MAG: transcriptional regulator [Flavobacterium sp.]
MISGKFAITLHILTLLAMSEGEFLSSEYIAGSLNVNAVLVRKEIANLKRNGIVESREGKNGGTKLAKPASEISLDAIFKMTFETVTLGFGKNEPNPACPVGRNINKNLDSLYSGINADISDKLGKISLKEFTKAF